MKNVRFIKTIAVIGALALMVLTILPGCNFIGQADNEPSKAAVVDTNGNQLCCPICSATDITGPDAEGRYTCNSCGAIWDYNEQSVEVVDENGNVVKQLDANSGYVDHSSGGNYSSVNNGTSNNSGSDSGSNGDSGYSGGSGSGSGTGTGSGTGSGNGTGTGSGSGSGNGTGNGSGSGNGTGNGSGNGSGNGTGNGSGNSTGTSTEKKPVTKEQFQKVWKDLDDSVQIVYDPKTDSYTVIDPKTGKDTGLFGYKYSLTDKIFYTAEDSWQRNFGFAEVYDKAAAIGFMTYNTFRVYYTYDNLDWMIQFWKGQYGYAFIGSEIGVYTRPAGSDNGTFYDCADDAHKFFMTMDVYRANPQNPNKYDHLFTRSRSKTWWCTGFVPGTLGFAQANVPDENGTAKLKVDSKIEFYTPEMAQAFMNGVSKVTTLENNAALAGTKRAIKFVLCGSEEEYEACTSSAKYCLCDDGVSVRICYR